MLRLRQHIFGQEGKAIFLEPEIHGDGRNYVGLGRIDDSKANELYKQKDLFDSSTVPLEDKLSMIRHVLLRNKLEDLVKIEKFLLNTLQENTLPEFRKLRVVDDFNNSRNGRMLYRTIEWIHYTTIEAFWTLYKSDITLPSKLTALYYILRNDSQTHRKKEALEFLVDYATRNQEIMPVMSLANITDLLTASEFPEARDAGLRLLDVVRRREAEEEKLFLENIERNRVYGILDRGRGVFGDSQNVHDSNINNSIKESLCILAKDRQRDGDEPILSKNPIEVLEQIQNSLEERKLLNLQTINSLQRIATDYALFTDEHRFRLRDIIQRVWNRIINYIPKEHREDAIKRLSEELVEMSGTCSTGHMSRLVNVLSGFEGGLSQIRISWASQIRSNISARIQAQLRENEDLLTAMIGTTEDEKKPYTDFLESFQPKLKEELGREFESLFDKKTEGMEVLTRKLFEKIFGTEFSTFR